MLDSCGEDHGCGHQGKGGGNGKTGDDGFICVKEAF